MPRSKWPLALAVLVLGLASGARGQDPLDLPEEEVLFGQPWSVSDSQEVLFLRSEARKAVANGTYEKAALKLQAILDFHTHRVVLDPPARETRFRGARLWVHDYIRALPEEAFAAYQNLAGPAARKLLDRAENERNEGLLLEVIRRYYLSGHGPEALRALASLRLQTGRYDDAAHYLTALREDFPDAAGAEDLARLALALVRSGQAGPAADLIRRRERVPGALDTIRVGDGETTLLAFLAGLGPALRKIEQLPADAGYDWPVFGGSADRERPAPEFAGVGPAEWAVRTGYTLRNDDRESPEFGGYRRFASKHLLEDHFPIHAVVDGGVVYYQNGSTVYARNLLTGNPVWTADGPLVRNNLGKTNPGTVHAVTVANGIVYANLEIPRPLPPDDAREYANRTVIYYIPQRRLFAFDAATGRQLWSHEEGVDRPEGERGILAGLNANSPPLVVEDTVYVTASRLDNRYFCYVLAVNARTGRILWRTRVCTGQQELNLFGRPVKELAGGAVAERDGKLYVVSNLGVAASLDRRTGEIDWVKGYEQIPIPFSTQWYMTKERTPTWTNAPPIVTEDAVFFTPTDSYFLVALERDSGRLRFLFHGGEPERDPDRFRRLIGVGPDNLYVTGSRVAAIDRRSGKLVWRSSRGTFGGRPPGEEQDEARGRGLVTGKAVWTATRLGLYSFDLVTGRQLGFDPLVPPAAGRVSPEDGGGNLLFAGNVLVVASQDWIGAFYSKEKVYDLLRERARKSPLDARVALELGEIYAKWGQFAEAVSEYGRAARLAGRLPEETGARIVAAANRGLFTIHMGRGDEALMAEKRDEAAKEYQAALAAAPDDEGRIRAWLGLAGVARARGRTRDLVNAYETIEREFGAVVFPFPAEGPLPAGLYALLALTDHAKDGGHPELAIRYLTRIIAEYPDREILSSTVSQAFARDQIELILFTAGRDVYEPFEREARSRLDAAVAAKSADGLSEVVRLYPNSRAAEGATVSLGRLLLLTGDYRRAAVTLRRILAEFPESESAPTILVLLAEALERRGYMVSAKSALRRLARRYPDARIEVDGRETTGQRYAELRLTEPAFAALSVRAPRVSLPLTELWSEDQGGSAYVRVLEPEGIAPPGIEGIVLLGTNGLLKAVDAAHHRTVWQREMNGIVTRPIYAEGALVLVNSASITALDPDTGVLKWEIPVNASIRAVGGSPGIVFVLTADFRDPTNLLLRAIGPRAGEILWQREIENQQVYDLLLVTEETVGVAARDPAGITVLDGGTGKIRFQVEMLPRSLYREPFLVDEDKLFVVQGNQRFELHDTSSGRLLWESGLPDERYFRSAIPVPGGVLFTDTQENLMLLDAADGQIRWTVPPAIESPLQYQGEAADADRVYVVRRREADSVYFAEARDIRTGEVVWRQDLVESKSATPAPIVSESCIVYHVNSYDFAQGEWTSKTVFLDREFGRPMQELAPEGLQGFFTYAVLRDGFYCLNARGKVAVFGQK